ncbi:MAG: hypothetical protein K6E91_00620 [Butyrivibrio sp.]|nr:hypothetical protein [Butyrivibrio sp.]
MALIDEISPNNLAAYDPFLPDMLKAAYVRESGYRFYGISESDEAVGTVIMKLTGDEASIRYMYIIPYLRGTGVIDEALSFLFLQLRDEGFSAVTMDYFPSEYEVLRNISYRFGFTERKLGYSYVRFEVKDIEKSRAAAFAPKDIIRLKYLPQPKRDSLFKLIDRHITFYDHKISQMTDILPYSIAYMEKDDPKGALVVESPNVEIIPTTDDMKRFPEPGAYDITLFFVGTTGKMAPLYLMSGLCKIVKNELPGNVIMTGFFPEGHVATFIEGVLGIKGKREVRATLDLSTLS